MKTRKTQHKKDEERVLKILNGGHSVHRNFREERRLEVKGCTSLTTSRCLGQGGVRPEFLQLLVKLTRWNPRSKEYFLEGLLGGGWRGG